MWASVAAKTSSTQNLICSQLGGVEGEILFAMGESLEIQLASLDRSQQILLLIRSGYTVPDIASTLAITEETVKKHLQSEMGRLTLEMQELGQWWTTLSLRRSEDLYQRVFTILLEANDPRVVSDMTKNAIAVIRLQKELLGSAVAPKTDDAKMVQNNVVNNFTFTTSSDLYSEALADMQADLGVSYHDNVIDIAMPDEDDRFAQLEAKVSKYIPDDNE